MRAQAYGLLSAAWQRTQRDVAATPPGGHGLNSARAWALIQMLWSGSQSPLTLSRPAGDTMNDKPTTAPVAQTGQPMIDATPVSRRKLFAGAGALGAVAAAAAVLPRATAPQPQPLPVAAAATGAAAEGGYQLTEHVKRYYQTARV
jgi:hypothetical protein